MSEIQNWVLELASGDDLRAELAAQKLIETGEAAVVPVAALLNSISVDTRWWAVRALSGMMYAQVRVWLCQALGDPDTSVVQAAALGLRTHPDPENIPVLLPLLSHSNRLLARLAGDALMAIGPAAFPPLVDILSGYDQPARVEAARTIAHLNEPRAIPVFLACLQDRDSSLVEYWAEVGLERLGMGMVLFRPGG